MKREDFKYFATFEATASFDRSKWKTAKAQKEAFASLNDLRSLLPTDEVIKENPDLLYVSFNAAVINLINANDHGMSTETALAVAKYFVDRHMNLDHSKWDVIGHIISQGYSSFGENKTLSESELVGTTEPFNLSLGAVVYKVVREYVAQIIEESADEDCEYFNCISASWEVGFNEFDIVMGSKKIADAKIVSDPKQIEELSKYLKIEGGTGFTPDGTPVYCLIKGDARPLGCAFTGSPAAAVQGVFVPNIVENESDPDGVGSKKDCKASENDLKEALARAQEEAKSAKAALEEIQKGLEKADSQANLSKNENILENNDKNSSQINKNTVNINMKLKSTEDITPEFLQTAEASNEIRKFIIEQLAETSKTYVSQVETLETEKKTSEASLKTAEAELATAKAELEKAQKEIEAKEKQEAFDARMEEIHSTFELNEAQASSVASEIKDLDETAFASWKVRFGLFASKKGEKKEDKNEDPSASLRNAQASSVTLPNALDQSEETDVTKMVSLLKKAITV
jgi:hypothetical protein